MADTGTPAANGADHGAAALAPEQDAAAEPTLDDLIDEYEAGVAQPAADAVNDARDRKSLF